MQRDIPNEINKLIHENSIVLFMKGTPDRPACGFSNTVCQILNKLMVTYHTVDILQDQEMRQGIKDFTHWPTIPQLYIKGEFVGGADIVHEMAQTGEIEKLIAQCS